MFTLHLLGTLLHEKHLLYQIFLRSITPSVFFPWDFYGDSYAENFHCIVLLKLRGLFVYFFVFRMSCSEDKSSRLIKKSI